MKENVYLNTGMALTFWILLLSYKTGYTFGSLLLSFIRRDLGEAHAISNCHRHSLRRYFACLRTYSSPGQKARGAGVHTYPVLLDVQVTRKYLHGGTVPGH